MRSAAPADPPELILDRDGRRIVLSVRRSPRARRLALKLDPGAGMPVLVLPPRMPLARGQAFAEQNWQWLATRLDRLPGRVAFADGATVPLRGIPHTVRHAPDLRGVVRALDGRIEVSGRPEHLSRRLGDWLRREARRIVVPLAHEKAAALNRKPARISLRDPRSRWGSCSSQGRLAFSWRLIMAPSTVLDYVVAHEVAHLVELNHSPAFWGVVACLTPHLEEGRTWLKQNGHGLHRYG
ncbi:MAG: M48 family metallopeptidase [Alphaproteobacteria bacterium]